MSRRTSASFAQGGIDFDDNDGRFRMPPFGFRCFHCNYHADTVTKARRHFGPTSIWVPVCLNPGGRLEKRPTPQPEEPKP